MLDYVQALLELDKCKTMGKAATALRVSQSAISKRVAKLESEVGYKLIAKSGRRVVLTRRGKRLVHELQPIMNQLRSILNDIDSDAGNGQRLEIGVSESLLSSWLPELLAHQNFKDFDFTFHAHRSPVVLDRVISGEYNCGICILEKESYSGLVVEELGREGFSIISRAPMSRANLKTINLATIEEVSESWKCIRSAVEKLELKITKRCESFTSIARLADLGIYSGLVPNGLTGSLDRKTNIYSLPIKSMNRRIALVARKRNFVDGVVHSFYRKLKDLEPSGITR